MTLDELIEKAQELREKLGGGTLVCCRREVWKEGSWNGNDPEFKLVTHLDKPLVLL